MSLVEKTEDHEARLKKVEEQLAPKDGKKRKEPKVRIPGNLVSWARKKPDRAVALVLGSNRNILAKRAEARDGNWYVDGDKYNPHPYEEISVYYYNKAPVIIVFTWRLLTVGGRAEAFRTKLEKSGTSLSGVAAGVREVEEGTRILDSNDELIADALGIKTFGQQTIIRGIEHAELDKEKKKAGGLGWLIWVILGIGIVYLAMKFFGK